MLDDELANDAKNIIGQHTSVLPKKGFVILAEMYSTGRGRIGQVVKQCLIGNTVWYGYKGKAQPGQITSTYRNLPSHSADKAVEALLGDSRQNSYERVSRGLRKVILAGLPELGKGR